VSANPPNAVFNAYETAALRAGISAVRWLTSRAACERASKLAQSDVDSEIRAGNRPTCPLCGLTVESGSVRVSFRPMPGQRRAELHILHACEAKP